MTTTKSGKRVGRPPGTIRRVPVGTDLHRELASRLRKILFRRRLSRAKVAKVLGCCPGTVDAVFTRGASLKVWKRIADAIQQFDKKQLN